jgi:exodeoxyribonuclease VII large subunit
MNDLDIFSVQEINNHIKNILENNIPNLYVQGQIANFVRHSSGHIYFSIKDDFSTLRCVFFKQYNYGLDFLPKNGDQVILFGNISLYVKGGSYQFNVRNIFSSGKGILQIKFEQLKAKLHAQGYFDQAHKKTIPKFPNKVALITSPTGAALQDFKNVIFRRFPIELILYPVTVQGENAGKSLTAAVQYFTANPIADVLVISRGGGSQEDLFCFNDEDLVKAIYDCPIPVISGVGHEIDFTLTDFVADLRAPTPSAAAELAVPDRGQLQDSLNRIKTEFKVSLQGKIHYETNRLNRLKKILSDLNVESKLNQKRLELLELEKSLANMTSVSNFLRQKLTNLAEKLEYRFKTKAENKIASDKNLLDNEKIRLSSLLTAKLVEEKHYFKLLSSKVESHSPLAILKQGFAYVSQDGKLLARASNVDKNTEVKIRFYDGQVAAKIVDDES